MVSQSVVVKPRISYKWRDAHYNITNISQYLIWFDLGIIGNFHISQIKISIFLVN